MIACTGKLPEATHFSFQGVVQRNTLRMLARRASRLAPAASPTLLHSSQHLKLVVRRVSHGRGVQPDAAGGGPLPRAAFVLGGLGALPFLFYGSQHDRIEKGGVPLWDPYIAATERLMGVNLSLFKSNDQLTVRKRFLSYGACILSFLGGIHWGLAMNAVPTARPARYGAAVVPSLLATAVLNCDQSSTTPHSILALSLVGTYVYDEVAIRRGWIHPSYSYLRSPLTFGVVMTTLFAAYLGRDKEHLYNN